MTKRTDDELGLHPQHPEMVPDPRLGLAVGEGHVQAIDPDRDPRLDSRHDPRLAGQTPGAYPTLFGNENYTPSHPVGRSVPPPTAAEWLLEAKEAEAVLAKGEIVSQRTLERLFLDAVPVIEAAAGGSGDVRARESKKEQAAREKADDKADDQREKDEAARLRRERER